MTISIRSVEKTFGRYPALRGISLAEMLRPAPPPNTRKTIAARLANA